jgi:hypothetical protein
MKTSTNSGGNIYYMLTITNITKEWILEIISGKFNIATIRTNEN